MEYEGVDRQDIMPGTPGRYRHGSRQTGISPAPCGENIMISSAYGHRSSQYAPLEHERSPEHRVDCNDGRFSAESTEPLATWNAYPPVGNNVPDQPNYLPELELNFNLSFGLYPLSSTEEWSQSGPPNTEDVDCQQGYGQTSTDNGQERDIWYPDMNHLSVTGYHQNHGAADGVHYEPAGTLSPDSSRIKR